MNERPTVRLPSLLVFFLALWSLVYWSGLRASEHSDSVCRALPERCAPNTLAVRFGDPRRRVSSLAAEAGEEVEVTVGIDIAHGLQPQTFVAFPMGFEVTVGTDIARGPLFSWSFSVTHDPSKIELLEAETHEAVLALRPRALLEETRAEEDAFSSEVRFVADIAPLLPPRTRTLPLARAKYRILDLEPAELTFLEIEGAAGSESPPVELAGAALFGRRDFAGGRPRTDLWTASGLEADLVAEGSPIAGLAVAPDGEIYVGRIEAECSLRVERIGRDLIPREHGCVPIAEPTSLAFDASGAISGAAVSVLVAGKGPVGSTVFDGAIAALYPEGTVRYVNSSWPDWRPRALLVHEDELYFSCQRGRGVWWSSYYPFPEVLPDLPCSLAISPGQLFIGFADGIVRGWDLVAGRWLPRVAGTGLGSEPALAAKNFVAAEPLVDAGEVWRYFKGTEAPPADWNQPGFDDAGWLSGPTGIGYGDGDDATILSDMEGNYLTVFCRKTFDVTNPDAVDELILQVSIDDGFYAYLNGVEVASYGGGGRGYDASASIPIDPFLFEANLSQWKSLLVPGTNLLAVSVHNWDLASSDLSFNPRLLNASRDPFWDGDFYAVASDGEYQGRLLRFDEGLPRRVLAGGFEGSVDLAFGPDGLLYVAEKEAGRLTRLLPRFVGQPEPVIFVSQGKDILRHYRGATQLAFTDGWGTPGPWDALTSDDWGRLRGVDGEYSFAFSDLFGAGRRGYDDEFDHGVSAAEWVAGAFLESHVPDVVRDGQNSIELLRRRGAFLTVYASFPLGDSHLFIFLEEDDFPQYSVGKTGSTGVERIGGIAFDPLTRTLYALNERDGTLHTLDWELTEGDEPRGTLVGPTGLGELSASDLAFARETGVLFATGVLPDGTHGVWTLDPETGEASLLFEVGAEGADGTGGGGIAVCFPPPARQAISSSDSDYGFAGWTGFAAPATRLSILNGEPPPPFDLLDDPDDPFAILWDPWEFALPWRPAGRQNTNDGPFTWAEYLTDAHEVRLYTSAFYRFTVELPPVFGGVCLSGVANVHEEGVVFLNGQAISPLLGDPAWVGTEPTDRRDAFGRRFLTGPTQDPFGTCDETSFRPGENELVFAVAGNAAGSGLEFVATVEYDPPSSSRPELAVTAIEAPPRLVQGESFEVVWEVTNAGFGVAPGPWVDRVYILPDGAPEDARPLAELPQTEDLTPGESRRSALEVEAPAEPGEYRLLLMADVGTALWEDGAWRSAVFDDRVLLVLPAKLPDLAVTSVVVPSGEKPVLSGTTTEISYRVENVGNFPTEVPVWSDAVALVTEPELCLPEPTGGFPPGCERIFERELPNKRLLDPGEGYTLTVRVPLPDKVAATYSVVVRTDVDDVLLEPEEENNYALSEPFEAVITDVQPDLVAEDLRFPPEVFSGTTFTVRWTDRNQGSGRTDINEEGTSAWEDRIYLSDNANPSLGPGDSYLGSSARSGPPLGQGEGAPMEREVRAGPFLHGTFYLKVQTDWRNEISEFGFEGNNVTVSKVTVIQSPLVDLVPVDLTVEGTPIPGEWITVSWEVSNVGGPPLWGVDCEHSDRVVLGDGARVDLTRRIPRTAGLTYSSEQVLQVPWGFPSGPAVVRVEVDTLDEVAEDVEDNNAASVTVHVSEDPEYPDLELELLPPLPSAVIAGESIVLRWRVTNKGERGTAPDRTWSDEVRLGELLLDRVTAPATLGPEESYTQERELALTRYTDLQASPGTYILEITTALGIAEGLARDARKENNRIEVPITVEANPSDVAVTDIRFLEAPAGWLRIEWTIQNVSPYSTVGTGWYVDVYREANLKLRVGGRSLNRQLAPGESYSDVLDIRIPNDFGGMLWVSVRHSYPFDINPSNNLLKEGIFVPHVPDEPDEPELPPPNIVVADVRVLGEAVAGQPVRVSWTVANLGDGPTQGTFWNSVRLSADEVFGGNDLFLGQVEHRGVLEPPESYTAEGEFPIPPGVSGPHFLFVSSSVREEPQETRSDNHSAVAVTVASPPPDVDLEVSEILVASSGVLGERAQVTWSITNHGAQAAAGRWSDSLYLSRDAAWDIEDRFIGRFENRPPAPLAPGEEASKSVRPLLGGVMPGEYHVLVRTDVYGQIPETDETNNLAPSAGTIAISVPSLELGVPIETLLRGGKELYLEVPDVPEGKTLRVKLDHRSPVMQTELYARHGAVATPGLFDRRFHAPGEPDQVVVVPTTRAGRYFLFARAQGLATTPDAERAVFLAEILPFGVEGVSPERIGDRGRATLKISGSQFVEEGEVYLEAPGGGQWRPHHLEFLDATRLRATFLLEGLPRGPLDLVVAGRGDEAARLPGGVVVEEARGPVLEVSPPAPAEARPGGAAGAITLAVVNRGNVDADYVFLHNMFEQNDGREVVSTSASGPFDGSAASGGFLSQRALLRALAPGETGFLETLLRPGEDTGEDIPVGSTVAELAVETFFRIQEELAETARQRVLADPESLLSEERERLLERVGDPGAWRELWFSALVAAGLLFPEDLALGSASDEAPGEVRCAVESVGDAAPFCAGLEAGLCAAWLSHALELGLEAIGGVAPESPEPGLPSCAEGDLASCSFCTLWRVLRSVDPNEKSGSDGVGEDDFVPRGRPIRYRIDFENVASAGAPAAVVRITDPIDPAHRLSSFRLERVAFGGTIVNFSEESITFQSRFDLTAERSVYVDVTAGVDPIAEEAFWILRSIEPWTGEVPTSAQVGFLPPNDARGSGRGWVEFSLTPRATAASGPIRNEATITFDNGPPHTTSTVLHRLDADPPSSRIDTVELAGDGALEVTWSGEDRPGGSGLVAYSIYVSEDGGGFSEWLHKTEATSGVYSSRPGVVYAFYSIAVDRVGNEEEAPGFPDAFYPAPPSTPPFVRGDCNGDGDAGATPSDAIFLLLYNFAGGLEPPCLAACDADGDGDVRGLVTDAIYLLRSAFLGGAPPPAPFPDCEVSRRREDVALGCEELASCR